MLKDSTTKNWSLPIGRALLKTKDLVFILSFSILTGISSRLMIEIGPVPITAQTLIVVLSGVLLGKKKGTASQIIYLAAGLTGLPWFSRGGGIAYIFSPSFGYIIGFILAAYIAGSLTEKGLAKTNKGAFFTVFIANASIYIPGFLWLAAFFGKGNLLEIGLYPFLLGDILKISLATYILSIIKEIKVAKTSLN